MTLKLRILLWLTPSLLVLFLVLFFSVQRVLVASLEPLIAPSSMPFTLPIMSTLASEDTGAMQPGQAIDVRKPTVGPVAILTTQPLQYQKAIPAAVATRLEQTTGLTQGAPAYFVRADGDNLVFQAVPYQTVLELPWTLTSSLILWGVLAFLLAWGVGAWGILRSLKPLLDLGSEISTRSAENLRPLKAPLIPELKRSIDALNGLFQEMHHTLERRKQQEEAARRFAYGASHELRNPLAALRLYLEVIRASPHEKRAWDGIEAQTQRTEKLLDSLLFLARLEGQAEPQVQQVDLRSLIKEAFQGPVQGDARVQADPALLELALRNLLENAKRYATGARQIQIEPLPHEVWIWVEDEGPGIPAELRDQVFEPFVKQSSGTGLGLALVKAVAQVHRGHARAENTRTGARVGFSVGRS
ncbi:sensor histidine kinase [Deinococcus cellulosilyticus]|uniref:histidine kinase n=1 Tax=Deinococcus cellulosilyticus (strain DSM 18568 / NBRC 106333 / KACC 11606 / 5516J-15) TaxID=1223518 RepID=A0A511N0D9_DEIC1|nr:HAMP domain-containing sensor histidine kinase [Deinococcus cellulosilyticus]GEM46350.1 hypothetical protein DC3_19850 [Deinococcus cellulosilyticus NBRC 106333 = KACC 11606]